MRLRLHLLKRRQQRRVRWSDDVEQLIVVIDMVIVVVLIQKMIVVMLPRVKSERTARRAVRLTRIQLVTIRRPLR